MESRHCPMGIQRCQCRHSRPRRTLHCRRSRTVVNAGCLARAADAHGIRPPLQISVFTCCARAYGWTLSLQHGGPHRTGQVSGAASVCALWSCWGHQQRTGHCHTRQTVYPLERVSSPYFILYELSISALFHLVAQYLLWSGLSHLMGWYFIPCGHPYVMYRFLERYLLDEWSNVLINENEICLRILAYVLVCSVVAYQFIYAMMHIHFIR